MTHVEEKWIPSDPVWLHPLQQVPVIAVVRAQEPALATQMAATAIQAGIQYVEIATSPSETYPDTLDLIQDLRTHYPQPFIGAGTILTLDQAQQVIGAGAQFVVSPFLDLEILHHCQSHEIPAIPGALTPGEIWQVRQAGATAIKVFPIESLGGAAYLRHLHKPLGSLPLIPTGGVTLANAQEFLQAGAVAVGIGGDLFPQSLMAAGNWPGILERLRRFVERLRSRSSSEVKGS